MRRVIIGIMMLLCTFLVACEGREVNQEIQDEMGDNTMNELQQEVETKEDIDVTNETSEERISAEELVDVSDFMDYYKMQNEDVPTDYIIAFIEDKQLTKEMLGDLNYGEMVIKMYERGVIFGTKITDLINGEVVSLSEEDDFSDVEYIVICKELYENGTDMSSEENVVLEVENRKIYITQKSVLDVYTSEENAREVSQEDITAYVQQLRNIITDNWTQYHQVEDKVYDWRLYIVKNDGSVIYYEGEAIDEDNHPGFEEWCKSIEM